MYAICIYHRTGYRLYRRGYYICVGVSTKEGVKRKNYTYILVVDMSANNVFFNVIIDAFTNRLHRILFVCKQRIQ